MLKLNSSAPSASFEAFTMFDNSLYYALIIIIIIFCYRPIVYYALVKKNLFEFFLGKNYNINSFYNNVCFYFYLKEHKTICIDIDLG